MAQEFTADPTTRTQTHVRLGWLAWLALGVILAAGAYFRFAGMNWDESQHLHPDERFLTMVETALQPVDSLGAYFNTAQSTLNPHNVGYGFFVYGTLPIFLVRYLAQALGQSGYDQVYLVGRYASAVMDWLAVLLVFVAAQSLFGKRWWSVLAAGFYAFAVLPIQLAHYFTVDTFANTFGLAAFCFAIVVLKSAPTLQLRHAEGLEKASGRLWRDWASLPAYLGFGVFYGLALASKINLAPLALLLPGAAFVAWTRLPAGDRARLWPVVARNLVLGGLAALFIFRIGQPYAFQGPGFLGVAPNQKWMDNLRSLMVQSSGDGDSPPELQWARRPATFAWTNLVQWGVGLPLGLLASAAMLWMGWQVVRGRWREYGLVWGWTLAYFLWQGLSFTRTMRYQLPIYPLLMILTAWLVGQVWQAAPARWAWLRAGAGRLPWGKLAAGLLALGTLAATLAWAFAFTRIYARPMTRVEASRWIFQNIPAAINLQLADEKGGESLQPISYPVDTVVVEGKPAQITFTAQMEGVVSGLRLKNAHLVSGGSAESRLTVRLMSTDEGLTSASSATMAIAADVRDQELVLYFEPVFPLKAGQPYRLQMDVQGARSSLVVSDGVELQVARSVQPVILEPSNAVLQPGKPFIATFFSTAGGSIDHFSLPVVSGAGGESYEAALSVSIIESGAALAGNTNPIIDIGPNLPIPQVLFARPLQIQSGVGYLLTIELVQSSGPVQLQGQVSLNLLTGFEPIVLPPPVPLVRAAEAYLAPFTPHTDGLLTGLTLGWAAQQEPTAQRSNQLTAVITDTHSGQALAQAQALVDVSTQHSPRGAPARLRFDPPLPVQSNQSYFLELSVDQGVLALRGSTLANETPWDDGLPLRVDGIDAYGGWYAPALNFEMYLPDDEEKLERFAFNLDQTDTLFISSNRQWATTTRVQERYPLTTAYYRALMGCPADQSVIECYAVAQPGMFNGRLGFQLVQVFQSEPALGSWQFNSQFAEEAFSVYDHPKVMIFRKQADYSSQAVRDLLGAVDLEQVMPVTPRKAGVPGNLMLPSELWGEQQAGGTWSELFDRASLLNRWPVVGALTWYLFVMALGWLVYPLVRLALGGLADRGYPLARLVGMLLLAFVVWYGGSHGLPFTRGVIWLALGGLLVLNGVLFALQRREIWREVRAQPKYYLLVEGLFLAFFVLDLAIRLGNPDLWHPAKGGEKPMDFSYLNAVLKSSTFPPYDPWFAGGTINYYYYGFVLVGVLIKALGIVPAVAYNLVLPMLFAMVALGAFSLGWNLLSRPQHEEGEADTPRRLGLARAPLFAGLAAALAMLILGNLGTINMIWEGFQLTVVSRTVMEQGDLFSRLGWTLQGIFNYFKGNTLPYNIGEWYWNPSRAIPGEPITEFPFFTFLYADLHAHMIALPVTVLALAWSLNVVRRRWRWCAPGQAGGLSWLNFGLTFALGGLTIGALRPTNTWDMPVYLVLGALAVAYAALRYSAPPARLLRVIGRVGRFFGEMESNEGLHRAEVDENPAGEESLQENPVAPPATLASEHAWLRWLVKLLFVALPSMALLVGLAFVLYQPFSAWFGQAYNSIDLWKGDHTPLWAYRLHWGVFLFVIASWMIWETIDWMAKTPLSALRKLRPFAALFAAGGLALLGAVVYLTLQKVQIAWVVLLMGVWALILIVRREQPDAKRAVLFMTGSALALTLAVELVVLRGDLGRMNTVFKFYLQAWTLFSLSAAAALTWLLPAVIRWRSAWSSAWQAAAMMLIGCAALFPLLAGQAKIQDRMAPNAPHTLDGMAYMHYATYADKDTDMHLDEDARAIQWMQDHIIGSPVIVEANTPEYRWGSRFTIYTGLPGVVGWNWHQRQQRALTPSEWVTDRVEQVEDFYQTTSQQAAQDFIRRYGVKYIVVGQLERAYYSAAGLAKFEQWNGKLWNEVYREGQTVIYAVLQ